MRALSLRQAARCETAKHKTCKCRCAGALHGAKRMIEPEDRAAYELLPADDPHHLPTEEEQKQIRKDRAYVKKSFRQGLLWDLWAMFEEEKTT